MWLLVKVVLRMLVLPGIPALPALFLMPQPSVDEAAFQRLMGEDPALPSGESVDADLPKGDCAVALHSESDLRALMSEGVLAADHAALGIPLDVPVQITGDPPPAEVEIELRVASRLPAQPTLPSAGFMLPEGVGSAQELGPLNHCNHPSEVTAVRVEPQDLRRPSLPSAADPAPQNMLMPPAGSLAMSRQQSDETVSRPQKTATTHVSKDPAWDDSPGRSHHTAVQPAVFDMPDLADRIVFFPLSTADAVGIETGQSEWHIPLHSQAPIRAFAASGRLVHAAQPLAHPPAVQQVTTALLALDAHEGQRVTEIILAPESFGRLRLEVISDGGTLLVRLSAEQSETQDLLRRQSEHLIQDLRHSGLSGAALEFGTWQERRASKSGLSETEEHPAQARASEEDVVVSDLIVGPPSGRSLHLRL